MNQNIQRKKNEKKHIISSSVTLLLIIQPFHLVSLSTDLSTAFEMHLNFDSFLGKAHKGWIVFVFEGFYINKPHALPYTPYS